MQAILVASDQDERDVLAFILRHAGLAVAASAGLPGVLATWLDRPADLIVAAFGDSRDLGKDISAIRAVTDVPLLLIVDNPGEDRLCALIRAGADLVLPRPVSPLILGAYAQALLRRSGAAPAFSLPTLTLPEIGLDPATRTVKLEGGEPQRLTQLEFRILYLLMTNRGQVLPTETIVERVWGYSGEGDRDLVRGLISRLRRKIEVDAEKPRFIQTVPGVGYLFATESG
ncbi:MAG TPA: response regulator transcription factor [Anaerolineales bacterium]|nr:response regulator transcription factor [Anaerolineales bacterium]